MRAWASASLLLAVVVAPVALAQSAAPSEPAAWDLLLHVRLSPAGDAEVSCIANGSADLSAACARIPSVPHGMVNLRTGPVLRVLDDDAAPLPTPPLAGIVDALAGLVTTTSPARATPAPPSGSGGASDGSLEIDLELHWGAATGSSWTQACITPPSGPRGCGPQLAFAPQDALALLTVGPGPVGAAMADAASRALQQGPSIESMEQTLVDAALSPLRSFASLRPAAPATPAAAAQARADPTSVDPVAPGDAVGRLSLATPAPRDARSPGVEAPLLDADAHTQGGLGHADIATTVAAPPASATHATAIRADPRDDSAAAARGATPGRARHVDITGAVARPPTHVVHPADGSSTTPAPRPATGPGPAPVARAPPPSRSVPQIAALAAGSALFWALGLYARWRSATLEQQSTRSGILALLQREPGVSPSQIAAQLSVHENTIRYHLRVLEKGGRVVVRRNGTRLRTFLVGEPEPRVREAMLLQVEATRRLYEAACANPGIRVSTACDIVGIHRTTLHYHAKKLQRAGLLRFQKEREGLRMFVQAPFGASPQAAKSA